MTSGLILRFGLLAAFGATAGCALWNRTAPPPQSALVMPTIAAGNLIILADFPLPDDDAVRKDVESLRADLANNLQVPIEDVPIQVHLYQDADVYRQVVAQRFPQLTGRRAVFVNDASGAHVYAHWSDQVSTDLRHELTHAYLNANIGRLPLWLDEGLAEYFEVPPQPGRINPEHLPTLNGALQNGGWRPNLDRLATIDRPEAMTQLDYAESWLWIHYLMSGQQRGVITAKLAAESRQELVDPITLQIRHGNADAELAATQYLVAISRR
ncbi:hypothetical protein [Blastopirellula marina]|uniref:DUF1570 domain-containing protein n=1 Tax=Blastopirellula marina TaxID=124 RepID=A0A2S8GJ52_9BACT|nr:hypothetical protein [Blastopirellula marina]PQO44351.1 hypothetical protein C5Y93_20540 [Blastopirellula marina]